MTSAFAFRHLHLLFDICICFNLRHFTSLNPAPLNFTALNPAPLTFSSVNPASLNFTLPNYASLNFGLLNPAPLTFSSVNSASHRGSGFMDKSPRLSIFEIISARGYNPSLNR